MTEVSQAEYKRSSQSELRFWLLFWINLILHLMLEILTVVDLIIIRDKYSVYVI